MGFQLRYSTFLTATLVFAAVILLVSYSVITPVGTTQSQKSDPNHFHMRPQSTESSTVAVEYDLVTLVHSDDMAPFIAYGLRSWLINLKDLPRHANIFIVCNAQAYDAVLFHLQQEEASGHQTTHNIVPIHEEVYPFTLQSVTNEFTWAKKPTWFYQQLLKLYSHQVLVKQHQVDASIPLIREYFTIIDSDTTFVHPFSMFDTYQGRAYPLYNVANENTGSFHNDAVIGQNLIDEVFKGMNMQKAFPTYNDTFFTAIAHMMTFSGPKLKAMLDKIDELHDMPSWKFLCKLRKSVLSEWELYLAWVMHHERESIHVRPIPYINWGMLEHSNLISLNNHSISDIVYLSKHDDYKEHNRCCVNSNWSRKAGYANCPCCEKSDCTRVDIDCKVLGGNEGCTVINVNEDGAHTMAFAKKKNDSIRKSRTKDGRKKKRKRTKVQMNAKNAVKV